MNRLMKGKKKKGKSGNGGGSQFDGRSRFESYQSTGNNNRGRVGSFLFGDKRAGSSASSTTKTLRGAQSVNLSAFFSGRSLTGTPRKARPKGTKKKISFSEFEIEEEEVQPETIKYTLDDTSTENFKSHFIETNRNTEINPSFLESPRDVTCSPKAVKPVNMCTMSPIPEKNGKFSLFASGSFKLGGMALAKPSDVALVDVKSTSVEQINVDEPKEDEIEANEGQTLNKASSMLSPKRNSRKGANGSGSRSSASNQSGEVSEGTRNMRIQDNQDDGLNIPPPPSNSSIPPGTIVRNPNLNDTMPSI